MAQVLASDLTSWYTRINNIRNKTNISLGSITVPSVQSSAATAAQYNAVVSQIKSLYTNNYLSFADQTSTLNTVSSGTLMQAAAVNNVDTRLTSLEKICGNCTTSVNSTCSTNNTTTNSTTSNSTLSFSTFSNFGKQDKFTNGTNVIYSYKSGGNANGQATKATFATFSTNFTTGNCSTNSTNATTTNSTFSTNSFATNATTTFSTNSVVTS